MNIYRPYTYLIGWSKLNAWYYGVEYKNNIHGIANPSNLWSSYFTSSTYVKEFRINFGEPDIIEIRHTFNNAEDAVRWEKTVLSRMHVLQDHKWLNRYVGGAIIYTEDVLVKMRVPRSEETKQRMRKPKSQSHIENMRKAKQKEFIRPETMEKFKRPKSPEHRANMKIAAKIRGINQLGKKRGPYKTKRCQLA